DRRPARVLAGSPRIRVRVRGVPPADAGRRVGRPGARADPRGHGYRPRLDLLEAEEPPGEHRGPCRLQPDRGDRDRDGTRGDVMPAFPTDEWFRAFIEAVNSSAAYEEYAATWEGDAVLRIEAEPDKGVPEDVYGLLDLWHGKC